jgi:multidrug resistance protein
MLYGVSAANFIGPFTQTIYVPSILDLKSYFGVSLFLINITISVFSAIFATGNFLWGPLADTRGRKSVLMPGLLMFIAGTVVCLLSTGYLQFFGGRLIQAIGASAASVVAAAVIADIYRPEERGQALSTYQAILYLGPVLGPVIGGIISAYLHWQWTFVLLTLISVTIFLYNRAVMVETLSKETKPTQITCKTVKTIMLNKSALAINLFGFSQFYGYYIFLVFLPVLLTNLFNVSRVAQVFFFIPLTVGILVGTILGGKIQRVWKKTRIINLTSYAIGIDILLLWVALITNSLNISTLLGFLFIYGIFLGCSLPSHATILVNIFEEEKATAIGVYNFIRFMGCALGPIIGGLIAEWIGTEGVFGSLGIVLLCSGVIIHKYAKDPYEYGLGKQGVL